MTPPERHTDDLAVWLLALGQTVAYGCLFYSFPALLVSIEADTGWSKPALALGPTVALVVAALAAPLAGRLVDKGWGGELLVGSAMVGALGLGGVAMAEGQAGWLLAWAVTGIAQGAGLYDACFAFLTRRLGRDARAAIIRVTLVAGFASTLTYPGGAWLGLTVGWRSAYWIFAAIQLLGGGLINLWGVVRLRRQVRAGARAYEDPPGMLERAMAQRQFWQLGVIFGLIYMTHGMLITFAIPLFQERGLAHGMAVLAASMIGPAQVAGRVVFMAGGARLGLIPATRTVIVGMALGICLLASAGVAPGLIFAFALVQGATIGVISILRPVLIADVLGHEGFGAISGALAVAVLTGAAGAPWIGALIFDGGGTMALVGTVLAMTLTASALAMVLRRS